MARLTWSGSIEAQRQYDAVKDRLQPKKKPKGRRRKKSHQRSQPAAPHPWIPYAAYLETKWWRSRRRQKIKRVGGKCERCGTSSGLQVHHLNYDRLWREKNGDLEVLCARCHPLEHYDAIQVKRHLDAIARPY